MVIKSNKARPRRLCQPDIDTVDEAWSLDVSSSALPVGELADGSVETGHDWCTIRDDEAPGPSVRCGRPSTSSGCLPSTILPSFPGHDNLPVVAAAAMPTPNNQPTTSRHQVPSRLREPTRKHLDDVRRRISQRTTQACVAAAGLARRLEPTGNASIIALMAIFPTTTAMWMTACICRLNVLEMLIAGIPAILTSVALQLLARWVEQIIESGERERANKERRARAREKTEREKKEREKTERRNREAMERERKQKQREEREEAERKLCAKKRREREEYNRQIAVINRKVEEINAKRRQEGRDIEKCIREREERKWKKMARKEKELNKKENEEGETEEKYKKGRAENN